MLPVARTYVWRHIATTGCREKALDLVSFMHYREQIWLAKSCPIVGGNEAGLLNILGSMAAWPDVKGRCVLLANNTVSTTACSFPSLLVGLFYMTQWGHLRWDDTFLARLH